MKSVGKKVTGRGNSCNCTHGAWKEARELVDLHQVMGNKMNKNADRERKSKEVNWEDDSRCDRKN
jgi:hypothetical protein